MITFNDFVKSALSNDLIGITDEILKGKFVSTPKAAYKWIDDSEFANKEIDRFTECSRKEFDGVDSAMFIVTLK